MKRWTITGAILIALTLPAPGRAQEPAPPPPPPGPMTERLETMRLQRMQQALALTDQEMAAIRKEMDSMRGQMRSAMDGQRDAMEHLQDALRSRPVDQDAVRQALERVRKSRSEMEALRDRHESALAKGLSPEKQAKLMLFNQQFDRRLRELIARHRAPTARPGGPPGRPGMAPRRGPMGEPPMGGPGMDRPMSREERIQRLQNQIDALQQRLDELKSQQ